MTEGYSNIELDIINISIGLNVKLERLKRKLSQLNLGNICDTDNTAVGRIERAEHKSSWENIYKVSQKLNLDFCSLFNLPSRESLLKTLEECFSLETKLTEIKRKFYIDMEIRINSLFDDISK